MTDLEKKVLRAFYEKPIRFSFSSKDRWKWIDSNLTEELSRVYNTNSICFEDVIISLDSLEKQGILESEIRETRATRTRIYRLAVEHELT